MPFGKTTLSMEAALTPIVTGRVVHDLGAGDCYHAKTLITCGASKVVAIDKEPLLSWGLEGQLHCIQARIEDVPVPDDLDVVFLGWPVNRYIPGLEPWLSKAQIIIYLGHNFDGTACGDPHLFFAMLDRRLITYIPNYQNSLIVVGESLKEPRDPTPEEAASFSTQILPFPGERY